MICYSLQSTFCTCTNLSANKCPVEKGEYWGQALITKRKYKLAHLLDFLLQFIVVTHLSVVMNKPTCISTNFAKIRIALK